MRIASFVMLFVFAAVLAQAQEQIIDIHAGTTSTNSSPALSLAVPKYAKVITKDNKTIVQIPKQLICELWSVADAKTPDDAIAHVPEVIKSEFTGFKASTTNDITIAGAPAKLLLGSGNEADDGDDGHADVVIFTVGGQVFAACTHGEGASNLNERKALLALLQTAQSFKSSVKN
jgi:hypothetical protein